MSMRARLAGSAVLIMALFGSAVSANAAVTLTAVDAVPAAGSYVPVAPTRVLDTRGTAPVSPHAVAAVQVAGQAGIPATGVSAVVLNVTVVKGSFGFITAYADGGIRPNTSNLNFSAGLEPLANLVITPVGANGSVDLYNGSNDSTQLAADIYGYYLAGAPTTPGAFVSLAPARVLDTRGVARVPAHATTYLQLAGKGGIPSTGVSAVVLNLTALGGLNGGFVTAYADGTPRPRTSNLNFVSGATVVANLIIAPVGTDGTVDLYNGSPQSADLVADVFGYYTAGAPTGPGAFGAINPTRVLDTRGSAPVPAGAAVAVKVNGVAGVPATGVAAVVLNLTATGGDGGYITAYPGGTSRPRTSNLNFVGGLAPMANLVIAPVGADGTIELYNASRTGTELIADVSGYYLAATS